MSWHLFTYANNTDVSFNGLVLTCFELTYVKNFFLILSNIIAIHVDYLIHMNRWRYFVISEMSYVLYRYKYVWIFIPLSNLCICHLHWQEYSKKRGKKLNLAVHHSLRAWSKNSIWVIVGPYQVLNITHEFYLYVQYFSYNVKTTLVSLLSLRILRHSGVNKGQVAFFCPKLLKLVSTRVL